MVNIKTAFAVLFIFSVSLVMSVQGQDDCLDSSVAINVTSAFLAQGTSLSRPESSTARATLIQNLYRALTSIASPYAVFIGVGYTNNDYYGVQSCDSFTTACAYVDGDFFAEIASSSQYGDNKKRYFSIDSNGVINISSPVYTDPSPFFPTARPWFNATGWSMQYIFVNFKAYSRSYVVPQNDARLFSDRVPIEPCNRCLSRSPAVQVAPYIADNAPLTRWSAVTTTSDIIDIFNYLLDVIQTFQLGRTITSVGFAFVNGDTYYITDCQASTTTVAECKTSRWVAEARNSAVLGGSQNLFIYSYSPATGFSSNPRDEGVAYDVVNRPFYLQGAGWTDSFKFVNAAGGADTKSYVVSFRGGIAVADANPNQICPSDSQPTTCPTPTPTTCLPTSSPCAGHDNNDVSINFYFADMVRGI